MVFTVYYKSCFQLSSTEIRLILSLAAIYTQQQGQSLVSCQQIPNLVNAKLTSSALFLKFIKIQKLRFNTQCKVQKISIFNNYLLFIYKLEWDQQYHKIFYNICMSVSWWKDYETYFIFIEFNWCISGSWTVEGNCKQRVSFMPFNQVMASWISSRNFVVKIHSHITHT